MRTPGFAQDYKGTPADFLKIMNNKEFETFKVRPRWMTLIPSKLLLRG